MQSLVVLVLSTLINIWGIYTPTKDPGMREAKGYKIERLKKSMDAGNCNGSCEGRDKQEEPYAHEQMWSLWMLYSNFNSQNILDRRLS